MTPITEAEYIVNSGAICPACKSNNISSDYLEADGPSATAEVMCHECGATWYDNYKLVGFTNLNQGETK
jgi:transcription initiation factor TFIIIB Brf1 subunit/transcription initiation factor TFIIB